MNLFQKYGIKEVADVTFFSITRVGDEEIYTPVLFLDTLKVSTVEKTAEKVSAQGGKANKKLISWNFGKEITLNLQDALFSPASMSLMWGGLLEARLSDYTSAIVKLNIANKYGRLHYSTKAYPSPALTEDEWEIVFRAATEIELLGKDDNGSNNKKFWTPTYKTSKDEAKIEENRNFLRKNYYNRDWILNAGDSVDASYKEVFEKIFGEEVSEEEKAAQQAMPKQVIDKIITYIDDLKRIGVIDDQVYDTEVLDRFEKCIVTDKSGFEISTEQQKKNLLRYYADDRSGSYTIYYDAKTMQPLLHISPDGLICGWTKDTDYDFNGAIDQDKFKIKFGTIYYKWTRTVKYKNGEEDGILGKTFVIDAETFPDAYKIQMETYVRNQKTGKDERCQIIIHRAQVSSDTNITLEAEGDPTTFDMTIDVLVPPNDISMEIHFFDVDEDRAQGGTRVLPRKSRYTYTPAMEETKGKIALENPELY